MFMQATEELPHSFAALDAPRAYGARSNDTQSGQSEGLITLPTTGLPSLPAQEQEAPTGFASGSWQVIVAVLQCVLLAAGSILRLFGGGGPPNGRSIVTSAAWRTEKLKSANTPARPSRPNTFIWTHPSMQRTPRFILSGRAL
jgi:hypothetical protein